MRRKTSHARNRDNIDLKRSSNMGNIRPGDARSIQKQLLDAASKRFMDFNKCTNTAVDIIDQMAKSDVIPKDRKIESLRAIYAHALEALQNIVATPVCEVPKLWEEREKWRMSPFDFVRNTYPNYGKGLCMADIRKLDPKLYRSLLNYGGKRGGKKAWPDDFDVPGKTARNDALVEIFAGTTAGKAAQRLTPTEQALAKSIRYSKPAR